MIGKLARQVMEQKNLSLGNEFMLVVEFLQENPDLQIFPRRKKDDLDPICNFGSPEYLNWLAEKFLKGREPLVFNFPRTCPDPLLPLIMIEEYGYDSAVVEEYVNGHRVAMVAENAIGALLERYIADSLKGVDWVWCSGEVVRKVDFIRRNLNGDWEALQVKNRDNSENSSSAAIRVGTSILKWHRTVSRTGNTRWKDFPDLGGTLSEEGFRRFVQEYLRSR